MSAKKTPKKRPAKRAGSGKTARLGAAKPKSRGAIAVLRPLPVYEFQTGGLGGYVRLADPGRGIEFAHGQQGKSLPGPCKEVLSLRHYLARGRGGLLAPREEAACVGKVEKQSVVFRYREPAKWPVAALARYDLLSDPGVDVTFAFTLSKGLQGFEAAVETLVPGMQPPMWVHSGGRWTMAAAGPRLQRFYPRNLGAAELIADGRWSGLRMAGIGLAVEPQGYDYPMVVAWEANSRWALVHMALTEECSSVWINGADRSLGMGLVGTDVKAKSAATCRVRALLCQVNQLDDVLTHYRAFVQEARSTRRR